jgi:hypothetical protein
MHAACDLSTPKAFFRSPTHAGLNIHAISSGRMRSGGSFQEPFVPCEFPSPAWAEATMSAFVNARPLIPTTIRRFRDEYPSPVRQGSIACCRSDDVGQFANNTNLLFAVQHIDWSKNLNAHVVVIAGCIRNRVARQFMNESSGVLLEEIGGRTPSHFITAFVRSCASLFLSTNVPAAV